MGLTPRMLEEDFTPAELLGVIRYAEAKRRAMDRKA